MDQLPGCIDSRYAGRMVKDTHTRVRAVRIDDTLWLPLGRLVGERGRADLIKQFIRWYLRLTDDLPERPDLR